MPPMVGIMAAKSSFVQKLFAVFETFKFVFVGGFWELGVVGDGLEVVVRLTREFSTKRRLNYVLQNTSS